jgi:hypothetical protein
MWLRGKYGFRGITVDAGVRCEGRRAVDGRSWWRENEVGKAGPAAHHLDAMRRRGM